MPSSSATPKSRKGVDKETKGSPAPPPTSSQVGPAEPCRTVRPIHLAVNMLANCHSSCCVEVGGTRVICALKAPQQLTQEYRGDRGRITCDVHRPTLRGDDTLEQDLSLALEGVVEQLVVLESLPQLLLETVLEVVADEGGGTLFDALSTALAATLAAGGVEMLDVFSSCTAALLDDGTLSADVTAGEERRAKVMVTVCAGLHTQTLGYVHHQGSAEAETLEQLVELALAGCEARAPHILSQLKASTMPPDDE